MNGALDRGVGADEAPPAGVGALDVGEVELNPCVEPAHEGRDRQLRGPAHQAEHAGRLVRFTRVPAQMLGHEPGGRDRVVVDEQHERRPGGREPHSAIGGRPGYRSGHAANREGAVVEQPLDRLRLRLGHVGRDHHLEAAGSGVLFRREPGENPIQQLITAQRRYDHAELEHGARLPACPSIGLDPTEPGVTLRFDPEREEARRPSPQYLGAPTTTSTSSAIQETLDEELATVDDEERLLPHVPGLPLQPHRVCDDRPPAPLPRAS